jgi:hypothetical protein
MSAGAFIKSKYEATSDNNGGIYSVRVQPETVACVIATVANAPPAAAVNQTVSARVGGGKRKIGMNCATISMKFTGTLPDGYKAGGILVIPGLTPAFRAAAKVGATGTYLGEAVEVVGRSPERAR